MSSLTQFEGRATARGYGLIAYLKDGSKSYLEHVRADNPHGAQEMIAGTKLPVLYEFFRKSRGTMGQWVVFQYNGEEHVPDLSIPLALEKLPRDARRVPDQAALRYWLQNGTEKPNVGLAIRRRRPEDELLDALLGRLPKYDLIEGTMCHRLYEYELDRVQNWYEPLARPDLGVVSFEMLPPGATRIPDQAALRFWLEDEA